MTDTPVDPAAPAAIDELNTHNGEPLRPTALDGNGVERIAGPPVENWSPAQVDPTDEQIAANANFHATEAARRDQATALLSAPTSEPLAVAQADYHAELDAAGNTVIPASDHPGSTAIGAGALPSSISSAAIGEGANVVPDTTASTTSGTATETVPGNQDTTVPAADGTSTVQSVETPAVPEHITLEADQAAVEAAAVASADADVEARIEADQAATAEAAAQADADALAAAEAQEVRDQEGQV